MNVLMRLAIALQRVVVADAQLKLAAHGQLRIKTREQMSEVESSKWWDRNHELKNYRATETWRLRMMTTESGAAGSKETK